MYKRLKLTNQGGAPVTQFTLGWMQDSVVNTMASIAEMIGSKVIVSGVVETAGIVTDGYVSHAGELFRFVGGTLATHVRINEVATQRTYADGVNKDFYLERTLVMTNDAGSPGAFLFTELRRLTAPVADYFATLATFITTTNAAIAALQAQQRIVYFGTQTITDFANDAEVTINHGQNIAVSYMVLGTLRSTSGNGNNDNDVFFVVRDLQANSFKIWLHEVAPVVQSLVFDYIIIRTN